jgi:hypothetical protein
VARRHNLRIHQVGENWLRPKEISESDKRAASLQRQIDAMKSREPLLLPQLSASQAEVDVYRVQQLSTEERRIIQETIVRLNPMPEQQRSLYSISRLGDFDHSLEERYAEWEHKKLPAFVREYERKLELNFGQLRIFFRIENSGQVPAESLLIRLTATGGWFNERYVLASPSGPVAPTPRHDTFLNLHSSRSIHDSIRSVAPAGKHEFVVLDAPKRSTEVQIACADFRHGLSYEYSVVSRADPQADELRIDAVVTAANLYGEVKTSIVVRKKIEDKAVADLIDLKTIAFKERPYVYVMLQQADRDFTNFEFDGARAAD